METCTNLFLYKLHSNQSIDFRDISSLCCGISRSIDSLLKVKKIISGKEKILPKGGRVTYPST